MAAFSSSKKEPLPFQRLWKKIPLKAITVLMILLVLAVLSLVSIESSAPADFPMTRTVVTISPGMTLKEAAAAFAENHIIRSALFYRAYVTMFGGTGGVKTGSYLFTGPQSALKIALRTVQGDTGFTPIKVSIPEGTDTTDMGTILAKDISGFDAADFVAKAKPYEGYLFPDTYTFTINDTPDTVIAAMRQDFQGREITLAPQIIASGHTEADVITMASIVEREATSTADREIIAGILWKRLAAHMPLQVDPPFYYVLGTDIGPLTEADLKINSPYNTYTHTGLPPTPIGSPGLNAIESTIEPVTSPYWYYVSGRRGVTHYAATLAEQNANIREYEF